MLEPMRPPVSTGYQMYLSLPGFA